MAARLGTKFKMLIYVIAAIAILVAGAWAFGPRTPVDTTIRFKPADIGADVDAYLASVEAKVAGIKQKQGKQIVWAYLASKARTPVAIVYVHGFSASPGEIRPVPDMIAKALDANLFFTRLAGHGLLKETMGQATVNDWVNDVAEAVAVGERLGEKVVVIATSSGASLVTWALARPEFAGRIAAVVLISPNYQVKATGSFLLTQPFAKKIAHLLLGETRSFEPVNAAHGEYWTPTYSVDALLPMAESVKLAANSPVSTITVPALFIISPNDQVVDPAATLALAAHWGGPHRIIEMARVDDPYSHVLAGDALSPSTTASTAETITTWIGDKLAQQ